MEKEEFFETEERLEKVLLVGVQMQQGDDTEQSLAELEELAQTAGAVTVGKVIQNRERIHPGTYIGKGKIEEVREMAFSTGAECIVCDDELSPAQLSNLEEALQIKVIDRTIMILDIFASRASTREGKLQVELAQLRYRATRLVGLRSSLSRLGGGIGTRGPGEKKLEMDRRLIKERISLLKKDLEAVKKNRETARKKRQANEIPVVAIVGYTNAGKSTLLNRLTKAGVLEEDKLFATLDPTTRNLTLESGQEILLTDTVGFIRKLPHHLIQAFRSTLEEARYADILLHVVDCSNPDVESQMHIVYDTLKRLEVEDKSIITAFNKQDKPDAQSAIKDFRADKICRISARTGEGLPELLEVMEELLRETKILIEKTFPYAEAGKIQTIRKTGQLLEEKYTEEGIFVRAYVPKEIYMREMLH